MILVIIPAPSNRSLADQYQVVNHSLSGTVLVDFLQELCISGVLLFVVNRMFEASLLECG